MADTIGFIGAGNMAEAIARGLAARGTPKDALYASDPSEARRSLFAGMAGGVYADNTAVLPKAATIVLAVKPQIMASVLAEIGPHMPPDALVISIAAGISTEFVRHFLPDCPIVRVMPNTPCLVGKGISVLYASPQVAAEQRACAEGIFQSCGATEWVPEESLIDAVTALSGSGPAYFFRFCELLSDAGAKAGLTPELAESLARHTFFGAARLAEATGETVEVLRKKVTSPGGTTEAALRVCANEGLGALVDSAVAAAAQRAEELSAAAWKGLR